MLAWAAVRKVHVVSQDYRVARYIKSTGCQVRVRVRRTPERRQQFELQVYLYVPGKQLKAGYRCAKAAHQSVRIVPDWLTEARYKTDVAERLAVAVCEAKSRIGINLCPN